MDTVTKTGLDALKTASKIVVLKKVEAAVETKLLIKFSDINSWNAEEIV